MKKNLLFSSLPVIFLILLVNSRSLAQRDCEHKFVHDSTLGSFLIPLCYLETHLSYQINYNEFSYEFYLSKEVMHVKRFDSEGNLLLKGQYANVDNSEFRKTGNKNTGSNIIYQPSRNGKWLYYNKRGKVIEKNQY